MDLITEQRRSMMNRSAVVKNGTLGMLLFIFAEIMFFGGLISAFIVNRADNLGAWPPVWQPRLPVLETAFNTFLLIISGVTMFMAVIEAGKKQKINLARYKKLLLATIIFGSLFVILQGREWIQLINAGMTTSSSLFGAFFYTIVGAHGLHVLGGLLYLIIIVNRLLKTTDEFYRMDASTTANVYWLFVVALWPFLYILVYMLPNTK